MKYVFWVLLFVGFTFQSCKKGGKMPPINNAVDLDGTLINDSSLTHPENFLLSVALPNPGPADLNKPVVICAHGFSATTFEWSEFRDFAKQTNAFYTSIVLLGGHGRDYSDFKAASWEDWQQPIIDEYNKLRNLGYKNIHLAGSSTGCPLVLNAVTASKINTDVLRQIFLIDPIVVPSNKILTSVAIVGPILSYSPSDLSPGENGFWYKYRPYQALQQLNKFTKLIQKGLKKGVSLPENVKMTIYKSTKDDAADPVSAALLYKGLKLSDGSRITVNMVNSNLHVLTRLKGRPVVSSEDQTNQQTIFAEIQNAL